MSDTERDDEELLARAREGDAPAFAVLVHRHAATLRAAAAATSGAAAVATVRRTFLRAMRRLDRADPADVEGWLLRLQGTPLDEEAAARAAPLANAELDELWRELAPCWPRGRRRRRLPRWVAQVSLVLVLLALAVAVPYALLVTAVETVEQGPDPIAEVVAVPIADDQFDLTFEDAPQDDASAEGDEVTDGPTGEDDGDDDDDGDGDDDDDDGDDGEEP